MKTYDAKILLDSISPSGVRLTTYEITLPKFLLAQLNTHRKFSRGAASSRAIPTQKILEQVKTNPVLPLSFRKNQPGMVGGEELEEGEQLRAKRAWLLARDRAVETVEEEFRDLEVHKQTINRLLEPFVWASVIVTATEWDNFFTLRTADDVQPEFCFIARKMARLYYRESQPQRLEKGGWHLPFITPEDRQYFQMRVVDPNYSLIQISVARCARVSYLNHMGKKDYSSDFRLTERLIEQGHWSPTEHQATPINHYWNANFWGWKQYRSFVNDKEKSFDPSLIDQWEDDVSS
jgi:thymidylate synthase ThyX